MNHFFKCCSDTTNNSRTNPSSHNKFDYVIHAECHNRIHTMQCDDRD